MCGGIKIMQECVLPEERYGGEVMEMSWVLWD
jgi:hypothetical protein